MGLREFLTSASRLLRTISKPDRRTFWLSVKVCLIGVALIGGIGYLIRLISVTLQGI
ncbi:MAG TPA: protein translocase SEC61 complex subunit gamma [Candidatus Bathyarchaeota archaeon]|nr:protein translocase SEC61 complex subunit gamma [Candidatus Bathyarchaeota archaeon]HDI53274.1 protein translocase SEC61 complex subunit gamma [Candidatus Bathyarchaeota archaeon]